MDIRNKEMLSKDLEKQVTIAYRLRSRYGPVGVEGGDRHVRLVTIAYRLRSRYGPGLPDQIRGHEVPVTIAYRLRSRYGLASEGQTSKRQIFTHVTIAYRLRSRYGPCTRRGLRRIGPVRSQSPIGSGPDMDNMEQKHKERLLAESQSPIGSGPDMDPGVQLDHTGHLHPGGSQSPIGSGPDMDRGQRTILQMSGF